VAEAKVEVSIERSTAWIDDSILAKARTVAAHRTGTEKRNVTISEVLEGWCRVPADRDHRKAIEAEHKKFDQGGEG